jgi:parvulin-like peptidyl-prolyl isomerase
MIAVTRLLKTNARPLAATLAICLLFTGSDTSINWAAQPASALVRVNHNFITQDQLTQALRKFTAFKGVKPSTDETQQVLQRLIDDELLIQRGEQLLLPETDPGLRKLMVQSLIQQIVNSDPQPVIDDNQLRAFYHSHQAVFEQPQRLKLGVITFDNRPHAVAARRALTKGATVNDIKADYSGISTELPQVLLPRNAIQTYLGSHLTNVALGLHQGDVSPPIQQGSTFYLIQSIDIQPTYIPTFAQARQQVLGEYKQRQRDQLLSDALNNFRSQADININLNIVADNLR